MQVQGNSSYNKDEKELTAGQVKREIKKGMSGAEVIESLGSPNIQTKDENGKETWVYDKIATTANYSETNSSIFLLLYNRSSTDATMTVSQKTLTVVIKLVDDKVESFTYHASKF